MGNLHCLAVSSTQLIDVARNVCPFPDYRVGPLLNNMMHFNSSLHLRDHYAAVQASLTPQQQQDFTQTLKTTFGQEGKVSNGAVPIVALSLAIFFDTVTSEVKGKCISEQEPIPGLFIRDPKRIYPAPVYTVSKYLRLVPHIANNPSRMREETEKYLLELNHTSTLVMNKFIAVKEQEDITVINVYKSLFMGKAMLYHLWQISNETINPKDFLPNERPHGDLKVVLSFNCDLKEANERFLSLVDSLDVDSKKMYKDCFEGDRSDGTVLETIAKIDMAINLDGMTRSPNMDVLAATGDFDLKANALGKWT